MIRFWFEFDVNMDDNDIPAGISMGCGVTAHSYDDALILLKGRVFKDKPVPYFKKVIENVDVSTLDPGHVLLNMAPPNLRGIWFPIGYQ